MLSVFESFDQAGKEIISYKIELLLKFKVRTTKVSKTTTEIRFETTEIRFETGFQQLKSGFK